MSAVAELTRFKREAKAKSETEQNELFASAEFRKLVSGASLELTAATSCGSHCFGHQCTSHCIGHQRP